MSHRMASARNGYRFYIGVAGIPDLTENFSHHAAYTRGGDGRVRLDPVLRDKRRVNISSNEYLVKRLALGRYQALKSSFAIAGNDVIPMRDFLVMQDHSAAQSNNDRVADLVSRLMNEPKGSVFCAMEISTEKGKEATKRHPVLSFDRIPIRSGENGPWRTVIPRVALDYDKLDNWYFQNLFREPGSYLVTGRPRLHTEDYPGGDRVHYVKFDVKYAEAVASFDYQAVAEKGRQRDQRRAGINPPR